MAGNAVAALTGDMRGIYMAAANMRCAVHHGTITQDGRYCLTALVSKGYSAARRRHCFMAVSCRSHELRCSG